MEKHLGLAGRIARSFIDSKLTPLIIIASVLLGVFAVIMTPREEEPQIIVPMVDVFVQMPGASAKEVENRVTTPMEKLLWEIPGVEYVYSTSSAGHSMAVVRFYVGQNIEESIVKLYNKLYSNFDKIPPGASQPLIKPRSIDDVPILALTFWGNGYDGYQLRRLVSQVDDQVKSVADVSQTMVIGGLRRQVKVTLDAAKLSAYGLSPGAVQQALKGANTQYPTGHFANGNYNFALQTGQFLQTPEDIGKVVVGVSKGGPVFLDEIATVADGPEEPSTYVNIAFGPGATKEGSHIDPKGIYPAVTLSVAKRQGKNAIKIADSVLEKVKTLEGTTIPPDVHYTITRNYGETATEKSNELLLHMMIAIISVTLLIAFALGKRESLVVAIAVPVTLALTLLVFYLYGYTLNRITLFALIFSIGILVDDAIVVVENIVRHFRMPINQGRNLMEVASEAVDEVGNPTILATFTVIAAILPLAFVGGLMGPYMRPIPIGATAAMIFSLLIAFIISPWASYRILRGEACVNEPHTEGVQLDEDGVCAPPEGWTTRFYRQIMNPLILDSGKRHRFLGLVVVLLLAAVALLPLKLVTVKMLPFDNKSEFQVIVDMPVGTTLEQTAAATNAMADYLRTIPEVTDVESYVGTASPYNFNGLVRHYFLRQGCNVADIQANLVGKSERSRQSHAIAKSVRDKIHEIGRRYGANAKVAEVPPGPPVLQTLVAEVYGPDDKTRWQVARQVRNVFEHTEGVTDVDWYVEANQVKYELIPDKEKAALNGIPTDQLTQTIALAVAGSGSELAHIPKATEDVPIYLQLPLSQRSSLQEIKNIQLQGALGNLVPLGEVVQVKQTTQDLSIYHKNLKPVVYVTGDVAGAQESPVYAILKMNQAISQMKTPFGYEVQHYTTAAPFDTTRYAMKWDGEWHITYEVFRDMGAAFAAVLVLIYILVVAWFKSFKTPLVIMAPIPLTLVGILPAHALLGAFFTATSMIGFIAGAGIIVRNSIILVDFIELRRKQGMPLEQAVVDAGAVRFRPMLLTAAAVMVGASVILMDPIFQGLAISLMAGEVASTLLSRMAVPVLYYMSESGKL
ncbi:MAG: efflux RND transporter permease subunit [Armatimonadetes bacterium]|nr:efflux RND transporter permease subunit [Armatimonadota bacterium]